MPIPDYQSTMRPLLCVIKDGAEAPFNDAFESVCRHFQLTEEEMQERLPSGTQTIIKNRVSWAKTYMKKAGLVLAPRGQNPDYRARPSGFVGLPEKDYAQILRAISRVSGIQNHQKDQHINFRYTTGRRIIHYARRANG